MFENRETSIESQQDICLLKPDDILIENNPQHLNVWEQWSNYYLLVNISLALNKLPKEKDLNKMTEKEFDEWLSKTDQQKDISTYKLCPPTLHSLFSGYDLQAKKSNIYHLSLSLENNSTVSGTGGILDELAKNYGMPSSECKEMLPYDSQSKSFGLKHSGEHCGFLRFMHDHESEMAQFEKLLRETDKRLDSSHIRLTGASNETLSENWVDILSSDDESDAALAEGLDVSLNLNPDDPSDSDDEEVLLSGDNVPSVTLKQRRQLFRKEDKLFSTVCDKTPEQILEDVRKGSDREIYQSYLSEQKEFLGSLRDHLGRTLLHVAVEHDNLSFADYLLSAGFNPNIKEYCGATPLTIAVNCKNKEFCRLLVDCGAAVRGPLFAGLPTPVEMAEKLQLAEILDILNPDCLDFDDDDISFYDPKTFPRSSGVTKPNTSPSEAIDQSNCNFLTGLVGDVGTCKSNRGVMERSSSLSWVGIIPGDLHMKGSFCESCFKEQGLAGFLHLVKVVMKRPRLTEDAFKRQKYEKDNLCWIKSC